MATSAAAQYASQNNIDYLANINQWIDTNRNATPEQVNQQMSQYGISEADIVKALTQRTDLPVGSTLKLGDSFYQPNFRIIGSGEDQQIGPLENILVYKENENKAGGKYNQYLPSGEIERTGTQQKVDNSMLPFLLAAGGLMFGVPDLSAAIGGGSTAGTVAGLTASELAAADLALGGLGGSAGATALAESALLGGAGASALGAEAATLGAETAGASTLGGGTGLLTGGAETAVTGMGTGTGLTGTSSGLGLNAAGTAGLGVEGLGAGLTTGTGLTGTGVLTGSTLGTGLLTGAGTAAGLTGTGILAGSELGTGLLGTTGTGALTGTGVLTGSTLGTEILGTGAGTAATTGGVTGLTNTANLGVNPLTTGVIDTPVTPVTTGVTGTGLLSGLTPAQLASAISSALTTAGGLLQQNTSSKAAETAQKLIETETKAAREAAQFRPVGTTSRFGTSEFTYDPVTGRMVSSSYKLSPEAKAQQDRLMVLSNAGLTQAEQAQAQFAPLQTGAQSLFSLGNQYLAQSPEQVAQRYISQQMNLLAPSRETELANLQNRLFQQGRSGLAVSQGGNLGATTPELQALYNARAQQDAVLAAQAQQAGQQQVSFGAGLLGSGASAMGQYYGGQQASYAPYTAAMGQVQNLEAQGQQPYNMSLALAQQQAQAGANAGRLGLEGSRLSTNIATGNAATTNPYSTVLSGLGDPNSLISQGITNAVRSIWSS